MDALLRWLPVLLETLQHLRGPGGQIQADKMAPMIGDDFKAG